MKELSNIDYRLDDENRTPVRVAIYDDPVFFTLICDFSITTWTWLPNGVGKTESGRSELGSGMSGGLLAN